MSDNVQHDTNYITCFNSYQFIFQTKSAFVERSPDAAHILKDNVGQVPLKILPDESEHWIKVNLDDAGSEVYKLSKVKGEERNLFRIGVKLVFKDTNKSKNFYSDSFQVKSKPKSVGMKSDVYFFILMLKLF